MRRVLNIEQGRIMVVTDLHGDYPVYRLYRDRFLSLRAKGRADILLFCGDIIHSEGDEDEDGSLEIMLDILRLRRELGEGLMMLLGNHEMPHLYGITLGKGRKIYTPRFEMTMGRHRPDIVAFYEGLPFYIRTRAGVSVAHTGASRAAANARIFATLADYSHAEELAKVDDMLNGQDRASLREGLAKFNGQSYDEMVLESLGPEGMSPERYDEILYGACVSAISDPFQHLWEALFNFNEREYGRSYYGSVLELFLRNLSNDYVAQVFLVAGHVPVVGGHAIVANRQLRLASWAHATPPEAGEYLLFDAARQIHRMEELEEGLGSVF